ncbi:hypothetical protein FHT02_002741 [Sphingomonas xinjiangensis]|uniref:Uncharacterized protein n=1 Tax=Sphingomonas xinjiangensis TaxID=643568 RepID=A0A840YGR3_9SPHN|nr:hypothetical protein [Sphingomonas xinjiangensis]
MFRRRTAATLRQKQEVYRAMETVQYDPVQAAFEAQCG